MQEHFRRRMLRSLVRSARFYRLLFLEDVKIVIKESQLEGLVLGHVHPVIVPGKVKLVFFFVAFERVL